MRKSGPAGTPVGTGRSGPLGPAGLVPSGPGPSAGPERLLDTATR